MHGEGREEDQRIAEDNGLTFHKSMAIGLHISPTHRPYRYTHIQPREPANTHTHSLETYEVG